MRPTVGLLVCAVLLTTTSCRKFDLFRRADSAPAPVDPRVGYLAPEIDGVTFDGKRMKLTDHRGKVIVLAFWFSRCGPCKAMIPHERALAERHRGKPFVLLGVNNDDNPDDAIAVIQAKKMDWPIWKTSGYHDDICKNWGVSRWPAVFVIDMIGVVRYANVRAEELDAAVETLLAELDASAKRR